MILKLYVMGKVNNLEHEVDGAKEPLDDEAEEHELIVFYLT